MTKQSKGYLLAILSTVYMFVLRSVYLVVYPLNLNSMIEICIKTWISISLLSVEVDWHFAI